MDSPSISDSGHVLEFKKENVKELTQLIKSIWFREFGVLYPFEKGIKITVDDGHCQQANVYLDSDIFSSFECREDNLKLKIPLKTFAECLNIVDGNSNSLRLTYNGMCEPVRLLIEDNEGLVIRAKIHTLIPDQELDFEFCDDNVVANCMLKTQLLKDIFRDLDGSSRTVTIKFESHQLSFTTKGDIGDISVSIPTKSLQMEKMSCAETSSFRYRLALVQRMSPVLSISNKVIMRLDDRGVLCCQFTIEHNDGKQSYVEFMTVPDDENFDE